MDKKRLKLLREQKGKLQSEAADELGLNRVTYNRYEKGEREPDNDTLSKIADYFNVSVDYLLGRSDIKKELSIHEAMNDSSFMDFVRAKINSMIIAGEDFYSQDPFLKRLKEFNSMSREDQETFLSNSYSMVEKENGTFTLKKKDITSKELEKIISDIEKLPKDMQKALIDKFKSNKD